MSPAWKQCEFVVSSVLDAQTRGAISASRSTRGLKIVANTDCQGINIGSQHWRYRVLDTGTLAIGWGGLGGCQKLNESKLHHPELEGLRNELSFDLHRLDLIMILAKKVHPSPAGVIEGRKASIWTSTSTHCAGQGRNGAPF